jgi:hypothetical protein
MGMGVQEAAVDDRIREKLGEDGARLALQSLWAVDCQTCNRPLQSDVPALVVDDAITFAIATLHHQRCHTSAWKDEGAINVANSPTVSYTCLSLVLQATAGREGDRAALLVNPRLEMLFLKRTPLGQWQVDLGAEFRAAGLRNPAESPLDFRAPLPSASARLRGGQIVVSLTGPPPLQYAAGANTPFKQALNAHHGLVLLVTQALNPPELSSMAQLAPVLNGDRSLGGWVALR